MRSPYQFKALNKLISRDLNGVYDLPKFHKYKKEDIIRFMQNPYNFEKELRDACVDIYTASSYFRRLISYFASLTDLSYVIVPTTGPSKTKSQATLSKNLKRVMKVMDTFQVKSQFRKILTVCLREDVFYGTLWITDDNITIQQLPSDYCAISSIEGNVYNVTFDFSYFDSHRYNLEYYPDEFKLKYDEYKHARKSKRYIALDSPKSFAIKCASDIGEYAIPPFVGILPQVYDLDGYKALKLTRTELENYAILVMKLGLNSDGSWAMDFDKAKEFWSNLDEELPDAVGSVLSPMSIDKISFDRTSTPDSNTITEATNALFSSAGVSSLLFSGDKASSNALLLSIKADQSITYGIVQSIADMVNRYIQSTTYGKDFKVTFLDTSPYNRNEVGDQYLKMCNVGMPMVSYLAAAYGMSQADMDNMNFLEDTLLGIKDKFRPLQMASTMSSEEAGRPQQSAENLSDNGEISRERDER